MLVQINGIPVIGLEHTNLYSAIAQIIYDGKCMKCEHSLKSHTTTAGCAIFGCGCIHKSNAADLISDPDVWNELNFVVNFKPIAPKPEVRAEIEEELPE